MCTKSKIKRMSHGFYLYLEMLNVNIGFCSIFYLLVCEQKIFKSIQSYDWSGFPNKGSYGWWPSRHYAGINNKHIYSYLIWKLFSDVPKEKTVKYIVKKDYIFTIVHKRKKEKGSREKQVTIFWTLSNLSAFIPVYEYVLIIFIYFQIWDTAGQERFQSLGEWGLKTLIVVI